MTMQLSRRLFLTGASALAMPRIHSPLPQPLINSFATAIHHSIAASRIGLDDSLVYIFWDEIQDTNPALIDTSVLKSQLIEKIRMIELSLTQLFHDTSNANIIKKLLDAERIKMGFENQADMLRQDDKIEAILQPTGLDLETWNQWCEEFISDDRCGLDFSGGIIRFNTGGMSRYYMDSMDFYTKEKPIADAIKSLCVDIHEIYPVNGDLANCSVLEKIVADQSDDLFIQSLKRRLSIPESSSTSIFKEVKVDPNRPHNLLPFQCDLYGNLVGNDCY